MEQEPSEPRVLAQLRTRGFVGRPGRQILRAAMVGMGATMGALMLGAPPVPGMLALFAGIGWVLSRSAGKCLFVLTTDGLERTFTPFWSGSSGARSRTEHFGFEAITSYRVSRDLARKLVEVESLRIEVDRAPHVLVVTDELAPDEYACFRDTFVAHVEHLAQLAPAGADPSRVAGGSRPSEPVLDATSREAQPVVIVRKPDFYDTRLAKLVAVLLVALTLALLMGAWGGLLGPTHLFRLGVIIVPGTLYVLYRTFGQAARAADPARQRSR